MGDVYELHNTLSEVRFEIVLEKRIMGEACESRVLSTLFLSVVYV